MRKHTTHFLLLFLLIPALTFSSFAQDNPLGLSIAGLGQATVGYDSSNKQETFGLDDGEIGIEKKFNDTFSSALVFGFRWNALSSSFESSLRFAEITAEFYKEFNAVCHLSQHNYPGSPQIEIIFWFGFFIESIMGLP